MSWRFALVIEPVPTDDPRSDFGDTFTEIDPSAPALSVGELSTQRGDGIFESIGVVRGHAQEVGPHLDRLAHSAAICDLPAPNPEQWRQAIERAAAHCPPDGEGVIKLILSRGVEHGPTLQLGQTRLKTSVPLVPPKPKPLDITTSTLAWRASLGT